ncbi:MAG: outer membrane lipoprotein carrier protein LolA [Dehalococcoidia bacterium]
MFRRLALVAALGLTALALVACGDGSGTPASKQAATSPDDTQPGTATVIRAGPLDSYYFEASVKTKSQSQSTDYLVIKGWFDAPDRTRWELLSSADDTYKRILLIDGEEQWFYEPGTNTYTHGKNADSVKALNGKPYPLPSNYQLGLLPLPQDAKPVRTDTYLGRAVDIYETSTATTKTTTWVDHEYGVTLRQQVESSDPLLVSYEAKVEKIQYNPRLSSQAFVFDPPPGAKEGSTGVQANGGTITPSRGALNVPPGLLSPSYIPAGYKLDSSSQSATAGVTSYIERRLKNEAGDTLTVKEQYRPGGLPDYLKGGTEITVGPGKGYVTRGGGEITLIYYTKDVIVSVGASALPINEIRSMMESMD